MVLTLCKSTYMLNNATHTTRLLCMAIFTGLSLEYPDLPPRHLVCGPRPPSLGSLELATIMQLSHTLIDTSTLRLFSRLACSSSAIIIDIGLGAA